MGLFRNKFDKLKRDDVVNCICELEKQIGDIETSIAQKGEEIVVLTKKAKSEKGQEIKLFHIKKINALELEKSALAKRGSYIIYNIGLMNKLKDAIDDNAFIGDQTKMPLSKMLGDQKALSGFLNTALGRKIKAEDVMTGADEIFNEAQASYSPNDAIYGVSSNDDALLAKFELENGLDADEEIEISEKPSETRVKEKLEN